MQVITHEGHQQSGDLADIQLQEDFRIFSMKVAELCMGEKENPSTMSLDTWVVTLMIPLIWGFNNSDRNERGHLDGKFTGE